MTSLFGLGSWYCFVTICLSLGRRTSCKQQNQQGFITAWYVKYKSCKFLAHMHLPLQANHWLSMVFPSAFAQVVFSSTIFGMERKSTYHFSWLETTLENKKQPSHTFTSNNYQYNHSAALPGPKHNKAPESFVPEIPKLHQPRKCAKALCQNEAL